MLSGTIVGFVERGKLQTAALRTLAVDMFYIVYGSVNDGVQSTEGGEGHGGGCESVVRMWTRLYGSDIRPNA